MVITQILEPLTVLAKIGKEQRIDINDLVAPCFGLFSKSSAHAIKIGVFPFCSRVGITESILDEGNTVRRQPDNLG